MTDNIYRTPDAELNDQDNGKAKRPILVWIIFIFACLGLFGIVNVFLVASGVIPTEGHLKAYYDSLGVFDYAFVVVSSIYGFACALQLFRLKRVAFYLYLGNIPLSIVSTFYNLNNDNFLTFLEAQGSNVYTSLLPGFVFLFVVIGYSYYLKRTDVLKP